MAGSKRQARASGYGSMVTCGRLTEFSAIPTLEESIVEEK